MVRETRVGRPYAAVLMNTGVMILHIKQTFAVVVDWADSLQKPRELGVGHRCAVYPKGLKGHLVRRSFIRRPRVAAHLKRAAWNLYHGRRPTFGMDACPGSIPHRHNETNGYGRVFEHQRYFLSLCNRLVMGFRSPLGSQ